MAGDALTHTEALTNSIPAATQTPTERDPRIERGTPPERDAAQEAMVTFVRRQPDQAQGVWRTVQVAFLLLNLWIGTRFYFFVRFYETGGQSVWVPRPPGVEGWLPIAALMNFKYFLVTGLVPGVHAAGMFLLIAFLGITFVARKAFCSWLCPVGTISEWLWLGGREIFRRSFQAPRWIDVPLRGLKYLLMGFFLYAVLSMSAAEIKGFVESPYGLVADVKMMNFFRHLGTTAAIVIGALAVGSVFLKNLWCRYLCPYGALLGLVSVISPTGVRRDVNACIDCAKYTKACPSLLPVDKLLTVMSAECTGCLECVTVCPARGALRLSVGRSRAIPTWAVVAVIAVFFVGLVGCGRWAGRGACPIAGLTSTWDPANASIVNHFVRGPWSASFDMALVKRSALGKRMRVQARMDVYNVFDAIAFVPVAGLGSTLSGWEVTQAATDVNGSQWAGGRMTQFGLTFSW